MRRHGRWHRGGGLIMTRLAYIPKLYEDELFYSLAARYHRHVMNVSYTSTNEELFGTRSIRATFDLPSHLPLFCARLPAGRVLTPDGLAVDHTHLPYHVAFLPAARRKEAFERMAGGSASIHIWLGLNASVVPQVSALRFCPECCGEMLSQEGELWWRRSHQLPGVLVCPDHGCLLRKSTVDFWTKGQHGFAAATSATCPEDAPPVLDGVSGMVMERLRSIAVASAALLRSTGEVESYEELTDFYRGRLWDAGLCRSRSQVEVPAVIDAFAAFYGKTFQHIPGILDPDVGFENWLLELCRRQRKATHSLLHVLFRVFLDSLPKRESVFGPGPWRCPNPEAGHGEDRTILEVHELRLGGGVIQGNFECACGYAYTMSVGPDGRLRGPRFSRFGPLLDPAVIRMVGEGETLRGTAARLGIHPRAVAAAAARLRLPVKWKPPAKMGDRIGRSQRQPRKARKPVVRQSRPRRRVEARFDWAARDAELAAKVGPAADAVLARRPLVRVCMRSIETEIDRPSCIYVRKKKLPRAVAAVVAREETKEEFQRRRIAWALDEVRESGRKITVSAVMRRAGVREVWKDYVAGLVDEPILRSSLK
ncbi:MAG TPA: TnsD family Tn7-like transposition protein [Allosphingosinicella sp.]